MALLLLLCGCAAQENSPTTVPGTTTVTTSKNITTTATTEVTEAMTTTETIATTETSVTEVTQGTTAGTTTVTLPSRKTTVTVTKKTTTTTTTTTTAVKGITLLEPKDGAVLESQSYIVDEYLAITDDKEAAEFWMSKYTGMAKGATLYASWESEGMMWKVYVSEDPQFKGATPIATTDSWIQLGGLMPGRTYYWKVVNGAGVSSEVRRFTTKDTTVRWIDADGGDNIRDLGGWKTESGKTVKYGLLYRGACIDGYNGGSALTQKGRSVFKYLGIKTEFDLRGSDVQLDSSPFGGKYFKVTMSQYDYIFTSEQSKRSLKSMFSMLSNPGFYPIYVHCNAGADRTGTFAFIVNGLLGVSYEDLTRDFELTCFSSRGRRLRSKLDEETATFAENGVMQSGGGNYIAWGPLYKRMMKDYGTGSGKLSDAIENFLITECDVTKQQIDTFRSIMLE